MRVWIKTEATLLAMDRHLDSQLREEYAATTLTNVAQVLATKGCTCARDPGSEMMLVTRQDGRGLIQAARAALKQWAMKGYGKVIVG